MVPLALNSSADILIENVALKSYHCMFFKLKAKNTDCFACDVFAGIYNFLNWLKTTSPMIPMILLIFFGGGGGRAG